MKESIRQGGEARSSVVGVMPLIFNKSANLHADMGAGDERDHEELSL